MVDCLYEWLEEHVLIYDQCIYRDQKLCLTHGDYKLDIEGLAKAIAGENHTVLLDRLINAACSCGNITNYISVDLVKDNRSNMTHEERCTADVQQLEFYTNICNKLVDNREAETLKTLIQQWNKWKDPSICRLLTVAYAHIFKPYRDTFTLKIPPKLWKSFFDTTILGETMNSYQCKVLLHCDIHSLSKEQFYFIVDAPCFTDFQNLKAGFTQWLEQCVNPTPQNSDSSTPQENTESTQYADTASDDESTIKDILTDLINKVSQTAASEHTPTNTMTISWESLSNEMMANLEALHKATMIQVQ